VHILLVFTMVWSSLSTFCQYSQWFSCTTLRQTFCYLKALYPHSTPVSPDSRETAQLPTGALFLSRNGVLSTSASGLPCLTTQTPRLHTPTTILTSFVNHSLQGVFFCFFLYFLFFFNLASTESRYASLGAPQSFTRSSRIVGREKHITCPN